MAAEETTSMSFADVERLEESIREIKACAAIAVSLESTQELGGIIYEEELYYALYRMLQHSVNALEEILDGRSRIPREVGDELPRFNEEDCEL